MCENIENLKNMECLNGNDLLSPNFNEIGTEHFNQAYPEERIADYFHNSIILVTGGTGFVGKALLEKLLRSCPGINTIYILMRPKRGLSVDQRYKELLKNQVFDRIRAKWPERLSKLYPITGDVSAPNLGVSADQQLLLKKCHTIFHSAATVKFTEPLHAATTLNVQGTATLLKLAEDMPLLKERLKPYVKDPYGCDLLDKLLQLDPAKRYDADTALNHDFFWTDPMPCDLASMLAQHTQSMFEYLAPPRRPGHLRHHHHVPGVQPKPAQPTQDSGYQDRVF